jgi:hypothetical protein
VEAVESKQLLYDFGGLAAASELSLSKLNLYRALRSFASSVLRRKEMDAQCTI